MLSHKVVLLALLPIICGVATVLEENYPFSHYPMYGDPDPVSYYFHLGDGAGADLPVELLTGKSSPKLGKILRTYGDDYAKEIGVRGYSRLSPAQWAAPCQRTLAYLRQQAAVLKKALPDKLRIMKSEIRFGPKGVEETKAVLFAE
jgi:hypothetical protein